MISQIPAIIILLCMFVSCASIRDREVVYQENENILSNESVGRLTSNLIKEKIKTAKPLAQATLYCSISDFLNASLIFKKIYNPNIQSDEYWLALGNCKLYEQKIDEAQIFYSLITNKSKEQKAIIENNLGVAKFKQGKIKEAQSHFLSSLASFQFITPRYNLIKLYVDNYMPENALREIEVIKTKNNKDLHLHYLETKAMLLSGQYKKVTSQKTSNNPDEKILIALAFYKINKESESRTLFNEIKLDDLYIENDTFVFLEAEFKRLDAIVKKG